MISKGPHLTDRPTEWRTSLTNELLNISPSRTCLLLLQLRLVIYLYYLFINFHLSFSSSSFILFHLFLLQTTLGSLPTSGVWHMFSMSMSQRHRLRVSPLCQRLWGAEAGLGGGGISSAMQHLLRADGLQRRRYLVDKAWVFVIYSWWLCDAHASFDVSQEWACRPGRHSQRAPKACHRRLRRTRYFITHFKYYFFQCEGRDS